MSLAVFNPLPDPMKAMNDLRRENERLQERNDKLETELRQERRKNATVEKGVAEIRHALTPVYQGLAHLFGEIDAMGIDAASDMSQPASDPRKAAVWDSWVEKLGGRDSFAGKMILALLQHGALTSKQIAIHIGTKRMQTVYETTLKVNKAGILDKNGDKFSLKEV